jgi:hypothetical protein
MVRGSVFFTVRTGCLNIIKTSFGFKGLKNEIPIIKIILPYMRQKLYLTVLLFLKA